MRQALNFGIVALVALVLTLAPGGGSALNVLLTLLTMGFLAGIALFANRLYRQNRLAIDALTPAQRLVLYGSIGVALLTFTATARLLAVGGLGLLAWFALLGACSYGVFWVYTQSQRYQ